MIVQKALEHWAKFSTRHAPQKVDTNEHFDPKTIPEKATLLGFDSAKSSTTLQDLK